MASIPESVSLRSDAAVRVDAWLGRFEAALASRDVEAAAALFAPQSFWRDLIAFTWNIKTVEGPQGVADLLRNTLPHTAPRGFMIDPAEPPSEANGITEAWILFETAVGRGRGHVRLMGDAAWTVLTTMYELKGHEEPQGQRRPKGVEHGADPNRTTWSERRQREAEELGLTTQPYVVIVGGGQGGLALGARLRQLGVPTIIVERNERPGDS